MSYIEKEKLEQKQKELQIEYTKRFKQENLVLKNKKKLKKRKLKTSDFFDIIAFNDLICRDKESFKSKSHNKDRQEKEYIKYLYFKYECPPYILNYISNIYKIINNNLMSLSYNNKTEEEINIEINKKINIELDKEIFNSCDKKITILDIIKTIATGKSLSKLLKPFYNKKESYYFLNSKQEDIEIARIEAKILFLNPLIEKKLMNFLINSGYFFYKENITKELNFIFKNKITDLNMLGEIIDYWNSKEFRKILEENSKVFSKNLSTMINDSNIWHIEESLKRNKKYNYWEGTFDKFEYIEDSKTAYNHYVIKELTNSGDLSKEGRKMGHCVGSYMKACVNNRSAILSLTCNYEKLVTIEISLRNNTIVQAKGKYNRKINNKELNILKKFALKNNLKFSNYL